MTEMTTIKVSPRTRDRLKAQATAANVSLGEHLRRLADAADRDFRLTSLRRAVADTPEDVATDYAQEAAAWETTELADERDA